MTMVSLDEILSPGKVETAFLDGLEFASVTILVTLLLEMISWKTACAAYKHNRKLYLQAVCLNFLNHYAYGIPVYMTAALLFIRDDDVNRTPFTVAGQVVAILLVHSICYYEAHKTFHSCPGYYKYHKFHHRFNTYVPPMSANAVGFVEYLVAYVLPFAVAGGIVRPYVTSIRWAVYIVSVTNLSIHTPKIEAWSERHIPAWWVSTHDHLEHHRKLNVHYAAPTMNIDWAVNAMVDAWTKKQQQDTTGAVTSPPSPSPSSSSSAVSSK